MHNLNNMEASKPKPLNDVTFEDAIEILGVNPELKGELMLVKSEDSKITTLRTIQLYTRFSYDFTKEGIEEMSIINTTSYKVYLRAAKLGYYVKDVSELLTHIEQLKKEIEELKLICEQLKNR